MDMATATIEKNYKKLENRLEHLEKLVRVMVQNEIKTEKILEWERISRELDAGGGKRFSSYRAFEKYLKSL